MERAERADNGGSCSVKRTRLKGRRRQCPPLLVVRGPQADDAALPQHSVLVIERNDIV